MKKDVASGPYAGCPICGAPRTRLVAMGGDRRCGTCGSFGGDRLMHVALAGDLPQSIDAMPRVLVMAGGEGRSLCFDSAELYRCESIDSETADLVGGASALACLPDGCFDIVVIDAHFARTVDPVPVLSEMWRVLGTDGWLLAPAMDREPSDLIFALQRLYEPRFLPGFDLVTRRSGCLLLVVGRKDGALSDAQQGVDEKLTGYAYHLSRRSARRIVFCLDGSRALDDPLPVKAVSGETIGTVRVSSYTGLQSLPPEPWREGFRLPPRATFDLDPSLPSGIYALGGEIPFVHRGHDAASIALLIPSHTSTAFNPAGGRNMYVTRDAPAADALSFQRPITPMRLSEGCWPFVKWFAEANPYRYDTTYLLDSDLEEPDALGGVEVLIVIGRSEYWTRGARESFDAYVDQGGRALLLCSEIMHWQARVDLMRQQLLCPKGHDRHPDPMLRADLWHSPSLGYPIYPRTGCELWYGGSGATGFGIGWDGMRIVCPDSPLLEGSGLATDDVVWLPDTTEWDGAPVHRYAGGVPQVDFGASPPWCHEVIGYNLVKPAVDELPQGKPATSLWLVLRRTPESGTVIHGGSMAWCGERAVGDTGPDCERNRRIVLRMLQILRDNAWPFSDSQIGPLPQASDAAASM